MKERAVMKEEEYFTLTAVRVSEEVNLSIEVEGFTRLEAVGILQSAIHGILSDESRLTGLQTAKQQRGQ